MLNNLNNYRIVLASNSPRRQELLAGLGVAFSVRTIDDLDESFPEHINPALVAEFIACKKAQAYRATIQQDELLITADTVVSVNDIILGKPKDRGDAVQMLRTLSGKQHEVYTGVCLTSLRHQLMFTAQTKVFFTWLTDDEIFYYVDTYKPYDKAGAYGVQEWIGYVAVDRMEGSYYNVMGLPVHSLYLALSKFPERND